MFKRQTEGAVLIHDGDTDAWLPKSQIILVDEEWDDIEEDEIINIEVPDWLAEEKGVI